MYKPINSKLGMLYVWIFFFPMPNEKKFGYTIILNVSSGISFGRFFFSWKVGVWLSFAFLLVLLCFSLFLSFSFSVKEKDDGAKEDGVFFREV